VLRYVTLFVTSLIINHLNVIFY